MSNRYRITAAAPLRVAASIISIALAPQAYAQETTIPETTIPEITVTALRAEQTLQRTGSAVTVITREDIARSSARDVDDLLRQSPGLSINTSGGPGQLQNVLLRGAEARHTLVLVDGVRINDPSTTGGEMDFSAIALDNVERIEILRGPQSALYGSDAMGGVIQIITRKGRSGHGGAISVEAGSFGTKETRANLHGAQGPVFYSLGISAFNTDGFSAVGYRIPRIAGTLPPLEADGATRISGDFNIGWRATENLTLEAGVSRTDNRVAIDSVGSYPDVPGNTRTILTRSYLSATHLAFDGLLRSKLTLFSTQTDRTLNTFFRYGAGATDFSGTRFAYQGEREGAEYQGDLRLGAFGQLTLGARTERDKARQGMNELYPVATSDTTNVNARQTTNSAFGVWSKTIGENWNVSLGARLDDVSGADDIKGGRGGVTFGTWRATSSYLITQTGTKLRGSIGTGAKAPSLYQLYSEYGTNDLAPEKSLGLDIGFDQRLNSRLDLSASYFSNSFRNLIDFASTSPPCGINQFTEYFGEKYYGCYVNIARAKTQGAELELKASLVPEFARLKAAYTYLDAKDETTGLDLARRPKHAARLALELRPREGLLIEPRVTFVGARFDAPGEKRPLSGYAKLDAYGEYRISENATAYVRLENITNTRYENVLNYGTAGRSGYAGLRVKW